MKKEYIESVTLAYSQTETKRFAIVARRAFSPLINGFYGEGRREVSNVVEFCIFNLGAIHFLEAGFIPVVESKPNKIRKNITVFFIKDPEISKFVKKRIFDQYLELLGSYYLSDPDYHGSTLILNPAVFCLSEK